jgi:hypothetical protein
MIWIHVCTLTPSSELFYSPVNWKSHILSNLTSHLRRALALIISQVRSVAIAAMSFEVKKEGDISDTFASMSGNEHAALPDRFRELKLSLAVGHETEIKEGWKRLLKELRKENEMVAAQGSNIIPVIEFSDLDNDLKRLKDEIRKRGAAVIRGVVPEIEARAYKADIEEYARTNPSTRGNNHSSFYRRPLLTPAQC